MTPEQLKKARLDAGLSQEEAAALVYISTSNWRKWESEMPLGKAERNNRRARVELFEFKVREQSK
jgi:DNA-binding transcriptional regulator YiaG